MLYRKNIEPRCIYCRHGSPLEYGKMACRRKGIVDISYHCRHFTYDPLMRVPPRPAVLKKDFSPEDFSLQID